MNQADYSEREGNYPKPFVTEDDVVKQVYFELLNKEGKTSFIQYNGLNPSRFQKELEGLGYIVEETDKKKIQEVLPDTLL